MNALICTVAQGFKSLGEVAQLGIKGAYTLLKHFCGCCKNGTRRPQIDISIGPWCTMLSQEMPERYRDDGMQAHAHHLLRELPRAWQNLRRGTRTDTVTLKTLLYCSTVTNLMILDCIYIYSSSHSIYYILYFWTKLIFVVLFDAHFAFYSILNARKKVQRVPKIGAAP